MTRNPFVHWAFPGAGMSVEQQVEERGRVALGLMRRGDTYFTGSRRGVLLQVAFVGNERIRGTNRRTPAETTIEAAIQPPLDLGLQIRGRSAHAYDAGAEEPERLNALLFHGLSHQLTTLPGALELSIDDRRVSMSRPGWHLDELTGDGLDTAVRMALAIQAARRALPVATALQAHAEAWMELARAHRLTFTTSPVAVSGALDDIGVSAWIERKPAVAGVFQEGVERAARTFKATFRAAFPTSLPFQLDALRSKPNLLEVLAWVHVTDATIDNEAFDDQFRVLTDRPDLAKRALGPIADALVRYARAGAVHVSGNGITFSPETLGTPDAVAPVLQDLARLATLLTDAVHDRPKARGVYR